MLQNTPSAKRFNRVGQGNRCTSRYEIYNSTTRPFGKSYREMITSTDIKINQESTDTCESSTDTNPSAYATCCSEVETLNITGFKCVDENATKHEVTLQTTIGDEITEARNYNVNTNDHARVIDEKLKSTEIVKKVDEKHRLMYNMPTTSTWKTYQEEQLTYEPENQQIHKEVVIRSRSLLNLQEPAEITLDKPEKWVKSTSEIHLFEHDTKRKPKIVQTTPSKKYSSGVNLTIGNDSIKLNNNIKYKSQSDLCAIVEEPKKLERPKSMDFLLTPRENKSHAETLKKHFYYHPLKPNKKLNDNELPDPDKVLCTRQLFQKELKIPLPPSMNNQNPRTGPRPTQEIRIIPAETHKSKLKKCVSVDMGTNIHNRWTDSGSVSSGVGSEASFDTESSETNHRADGYSSDDEDYLTDKTTVEVVGRPVSAEILNKIRKFGTSVTYYGGKVISSSRGVVCSPMTMTIMDEIRHQKEENVKLRLVKSNSCGSRIELMEEPKRSEMHVEAIQEEDEDEERQSASSARTTEDNNSSISKLSSASSDEMSWKALIVIRKKTNSTPVFDMEFEEFEVLEENNS